MTSCMPPASSKKRSKTSASCVGGPPSAALAAARYSTSCSAAASAMRDLRAQARHRDRQLVAAAGRLAEPERDGRRRALRVLDAHRAALDANDAIGGVAELEDVALQALDGEILVDRADDLALRLE